MKDPPTRRVQPVRVLVQVVTSSTDRTDRRCGLDRARARGEHGVARVDLLLLVLLLLVGATGLEY